MKGPVQIVVIVDGSAISPVYHDYGTFTMDHIGRVTPYTACGVEVGSMWGARLREEHAALFARPCRRCFTDAEVPS